MNNTVRRFPLGVRIRSLVLLVAAGALVFGPLVVGTSSAVAAGGPTDFTPPGLQNATGSIQGLMLNESGGHFSSPGAVISIDSQYIPPAGTINLQRVTDLHEQGSAQAFGVYPGAYMIPGIRPPANGFTVKVEPRFHRVGVSIPDGYNAQVSIALGSISHPAGSFVTLQPGTGSFWVNPGNSYVDVHVRYVRTQAPIASDVSQVLTCNEPARAVTPTDPSTIRTFNGSKLGVKVGLSTQYGGIGSMLELTNRTNNVSLPELIDASSGGGAAWQTAVAAMTNDSAGTVQGPVVLYNQGAGNFDGQWGYKASFSGLHQTDWVPLQSDHWNEHGFSLGGNIHTSPCYNSSDRVADGQLDISEQYLNTPSGSAVRLNHTYRWRPTKDQHWDGWSVDQGMYLRKDTAAAADLRVYFIGKNGAWVDGPVRPYLPGYTLPHAQIPSGGACVQDSIGHCAIGATNISAAVFVWTIGGRDFAMVSSAGSPGATFTGFLGTSFNNLDCTTGGHECGNIEFHNKYGGIGQPADFQKGQVYPFTFGYTFGTLDQINSLGLLGNSGLELPGRGGYRLTAITATESLDNWPAAAAIDGDLATSYSSKPFSTKVPNRLLLLAGWYGDGALRTSRVTMRARMLQGQPQGFPAAYDVYLADPDNKGWTRVGSYNKQPDASGKVEIVLPASRTTSGVLIVPTELGTDNYGGHYFQLAELAMAK